MKRVLAFLAKLTLSVGLLVYLLRSVDLADMWLHLEEGDHGLFALAALNYFVVVLLSTWRWQVLLEAVGGRASFGDLTRSYMVSAFFANFLPSNIGGDLVRVKETAQSAGSTAASLAVAALDRIVGFVGLYAIAVPAYALAGPLTRGLGGAQAILGGLTIVLASLGLFFERSDLVLALATAIGLPRLAWVWDRFVSLFEAVQALRRNRGALFLALAQSVVLQFLGVLYFWMVARALRIPLDLGTSLVMVPLCTLIQAIPISFNGWGLREGLYVFYFRQVGLRPESALAFSIVAASLVALLSVSGLFVWLARRRPA